MLKACSPAADTVYAVLQPYRFHLLKTISEDFYHSWRVGKREELMLCVLWVRSKSSLPFVFYFLLVQTHSQLKLPAWASLLSCSLWNTATWTWHCHLRPRPTYTKLNSLSSCPIWSLMFLMLLGEPPSSLVFQWRQCSSRRSPPSPPSPPSQNSSVSPPYGNSIFFLHQRAHSSLLSLVVWLSA